ncbi:hypothetical protein [Lysobacter sp. HA18]
MKRSLVFAVFLLAATAATGARAAELVLSEPTVVVLYPPQRELSAAEMNEPDFTSFIGDFQTYESAVALALRGNPKVRFLSTSVDRIHLKGVRQPVVRKALGGYGFIVYVPRKPPAIFQGVATDQDVLCELHRRLPGAVVVHGCGA